MQIANEESDSRNEYGFYYEKRYVTNGMALTFYENGKVTMEFLNSDGSVYQTINYGGASYSNSHAHFSQAADIYFSDDGKTATFPSFGNGLFEVQ